MHSDLPDARDSRDAYLRPAGLGACPRCGGSLFPDYQDGGAKCLPCGRTYAVLPHQHFIDLSQLDQAGHKKRDGGYAYG